MKVDDNHPSYEVEVGLRISAAIEGFETKKKAANALGVSTDQLARYTKGTASPPLSVLVRLSAETNVSLDWLATGEGPMRTGSAPSPRHTSARSEPINEELMGRIVDGISKVYKEEGVRIPPVELGRLAQRLANQLAETYEDPEDRPVGLKLLLTGLRKDLTATAGAMETETKHRA